MAESRSSEVKASIVISTLNRSHLLDLTLRRIQEQDYPADQFETIIVDNGSSDSTRDISTGWLNKTSNCKYSYEPITGLSQARNRGISEAQSAIVVFLDDDARPTKGWLGSIMNRFENSPEVDAVGGPIHLDWEGEIRPGWYSRPLDYALGYQDAGKQPKKVSHLNGGNFAVRKEVISTFGGFKTYLGRKGNNAIAGEESDFFTWMRLHHKETIYEPEAIVKHFIPTYRQTKKFILSTYFNLGRTEIIRALGKNKIFRISQGVKDFVHRIKTTITWRNEYQINQLCFLGLTHLALLAGIIREAIFFEK
jgi:glucosyl-dolichyl phosphate glucuronosyltransferase